MLLKRGAAALLAASILVGSGCSQRAPEGQASNAPENGTPSSSAVSDAPEAKEPELPDTVRWFNTTYAVLTAANNGDLGAVGGYQKTEINIAGVRNGLKSSWDVTDKETADETLEWLLSKGHRSTFAEEMAMMEEDGLLELSKEEAKSTFEGMGFSAEEAACYASMLEVYKARGEHAIDAWDYCRALQLLGWYYVADYYTEGEAMDKSLEIAQMLQQQYHSWEELLESYLDGYHYWAEDDQDDPSSDTAQRRAVYEELKSGSQNPYELDWNAKLEKSW